MATHFSSLAWRIPGTGAWWAAVYGVAQGRTRLTTFVSSSVLGYSQKCSHHLAPGLFPTSLASTTTIRLLTLHIHTHAHTHTLFPLHFHASLECRFVSLIQKVPFSFFRPLTEAPKKPSLTALITVLFSLYPTTNVFMLLALL